MKFVVLVEGQTEAACIGPFLQKWLNRQLNHSVGIDPVNLGGWAKFENEVGKRVGTYLEHPRLASDLVAVVGLLDLYIPDSDHYPRKLTTVQQRYDWGVERIRRKVPSMHHDRFRMYFAVHEFEAWLLSQPGNFPRDVRSSLAKVKRPETVNFDEPPAKLLQRLYRQRTNRSYKKITDGRQLVEKLDPEIAAGKCPYLKRMLDEMLELAKQAGL